MSIDTTTIYTDWQEGRISPREALQTLVSDLQEIDSDLKPLQAEREAIRELIGDIAVSLSEPFEHNGLEVAWVQPTRTESYDKKAVDQVVHTLILGGHHELAAQLASAKKEGVRSGYVRIGPPPTDKQRQRKKA